MNSSWVERTPDGVDRVIANGRRLELLRLRPIRLGPSSQSVAGGARAPGWTAGPSQYVFYRGGFYRGAEIFTAESFTGNLVPLGTARSSVRGTFDWLNGTGLLLSDGALVVPTSGTPPIEALPMGIVDAAAADGKRAVAMTVFGKARLSTDGATFLSKPTGGGRISVQGKDFILTFPEGEHGILDDTGALRPLESPQFNRRPRGEPPPESPDPFPEKRDDLVLLAARSGAPLSDGGIVVASHGYVARFDPDSLRTTSVVRLDPSLVEAECVALRTADGLVLACADGERATVVNLDGPPRIERVFDLSTLPVRDRFVGVDGGTLGFVGPCGHQATAEDQLPDENSGGDVANGSLQRSPVFCVRRGPDDWVEHRVERADGPDVVAWIPRASGHAVALVARPGNFIDDRERVSTRGPLRVVRLARGEPPVAIPPYASRSSVTLDRSFEVDASNAIHGFLTSPSGTSAAVTIEADGRPVSHPLPPSIAALSFSGRLGLLLTEDGALYETQDHGRHFTRVEAPPVRGADLTMACSEVGCDMNAVARLGWGGADASQDHTSSANVGFAPLPPTLGPVYRSRCTSVGGTAVCQNLTPRPRGFARLQCTIGGPLVTGLATDFQGLAVVNKLQQGTTHVRIASLGELAYRWNSATKSLTGDVTLSVLTPFEVAGTIRRVTIPPSLQGLLPTQGHRLRQQQVGFVLGHEVRPSVSIVPTQTADGCYGKILALSGLTGGLTSCTEQPALGVDLGTRTMLLTSSSGTLEVSTAEPASDATTRPPTGKGSLSLRKLSRVPLGPGVGGYAFGVGTRGGQPVAVAVDEGGSAVLAPMDVNTGAFGSEEALAPLTRLTLASDPICKNGPSDARILVGLRNGITFELARAERVGVDTGVTLAVIRWSAERACLEAIDLPVLDQRFDVTSWDLGGIRKFVGLFDGRGGKKGSSAQLVYMGTGVELRQRVECTGIIPVQSEGP